jgi:hypothetical protein
MAAIGRHFDPPKPRDIVSAFQASYDALAQAHAKLTRAREMNEELALDPDPGALVGFVVTEAIIQRLEGEVEKREEELGRWRWFQQKVLPDQAEILEAQIEPATLAEIDVLAAMVDEP